MGVLRGFRAHWNFHELLSWKGFLRQLLHRAGQRSPVLLVGLSQDLLLMSLQALHRASERSKVRVLRGKDNVGDFTCLHGSVCPLSALDDHARVLPSDLNRHKSLFLRASVGALSVRVTIECQMHGVLCRTARVSVTHTGPPSHRRGHPCRRAHRQGSPDPHTQRSGSCRPSR